MALGGQIGREPGEEEDQHRITGELPDAGAENLPFSQQLANQRPAKGGMLLRAGGHSATVDNVLALQLIEMFILMRLAVAAPPHQRKQHPGGADANKQRSPAEAAHYPEQQRRKAGQPEIFADGIDRRRLGALLLRKPGAHYPAVYRETGRFADAEAKAAQQQTFQANRHAVEQGE